MAKDGGTYYPFWMSFDDIVMRPGVNPAGELSIVCPFHDDSTPSLSANVETGLWYCHGCQQGGDAVTFMRQYSHLQGVELSVRDADMQVRARIGAPVLPPEADIKKWARNLWQAKSVLGYLERRRVLQESLLKQYEIGWDGKYLTVPVRDENGELVNVRKMEPEEKRPKLNTRGFGHPPRLWPLDQLTGSAEVLVCEGEMDCLSAILQGYNAVTGTSGAGHWQDAWGPLFQGKNVTVCYDGDDAGRKGAAKVAECLRLYALRVRVVQMPEGEDLNSLHIKGIPISSVLDRAVSITEAGPRIVSGQELLDEARESMLRPWLVDGLLRPGWLGVLAGHGKSGKTTLTVHLMAALAYGRSFLGNKTVVRDSVYWNYEMDLPELVQYYKSTMGEYPNAWPKSLLDPPRPLDPLAFPGMFEEWLRTRALEPGLIVIDPARPAFMLRGEGENSAGEVGFYLRGILDACRHTGWTAIVLHHFSKGGTGDPLDAAGSAEWLAAPDIMMTWVRGKGDRGQFQAIGRMPRLDPIKADLTPSLLLLPEPSVLKKG